MMAKEEMEKNGEKGVLVAAAFLLMVGMLGGGYLVSQGDYSADVDLSGMQSMPNVYVSSMAPDHAISTSGTATAYMSPDLLLIHLRVETQEDGAKESSQENAEVMEDLMAKLEAQGLEDSDIKTTGYYVQPIYESEYVCPTEGEIQKGCRYESKLVGYKTVHSLALNIEDLDDGGAIIDASSTAGQDQVFVDSVIFTLKDATREGKQSELLEEASAKAKDKAQKMAKGLGAGVGKLLSLSEGYYYTPYYDYSVRSYAAESAMGAPTALSGGEVQVSVSVNAMFEVA